MSSTNEARSPSIFAEGPEIELEAFGHVAELRALIDSNEGASVEVAQVVVPVAMAVAVGIVERGLRKGSAAAAADFDLVVGVAGSPTQLVLTAVFLQPAALPLLPPEALGQVVVSPGVAWASPIAFGDRWGGHPLVGVSPDFLTSGGRRPLAEGRSFARDGEAVVGADVPLAPGAVLTPQHGLHGDDDDRDHEADAHAGEGYRVVGRLPRLGTVWDRAILVPVETVWATHGFGTGHPKGVDRVGPPWEEPLAGVPAIVVKPRGVADAYILRSRFRSGGTTAVFPAEVLVELFGLLGGVRDLLTVVALAMQALVLAAVLMAILAALAARRRQTAVLRALGAPRRFVFAVVWIEVAGLLLVAGGLGFLLGWAAAVGLASMGAGSAGFAVQAVPDWREGALVAAVVGVGSVVALLPALWMTREDVAAGLRG
jgi:putative ABC transport system permease protein